MSRLKEIIKEELSGVLTKEGLSSRVDAMWQSLNGEDCEGPNRDICKAQSIIDGFLRKTKNLEREVQLDIEKLNLSEASWIEELFQHQGKVQNVLDHLQAIVDASPSDVAAGAVPKLLAPEWDEIGKAQESATISESRLNAIEDQLLEISEELALVVATQGQMRDLLDKLHELNETIINENENIRSQPQKVEVAKEYFDHIRESIEEYLDVTGDLEDLEEDYLDLLDKTKEKIAKLGDLKAQ